MAVHINGGTGMRHIRTLTPETVGMNPNRFMARCEECHWTSPRTQYESSAALVAADHVRGTGHAVALEEELQ